MWIRADVASRELPQAYEGVRTEMIEAARNHQKIASNIRELVVAPFRRWSDQHEYRVQTSHDNLQSRIKEHTKQADLVRKLRSHYFNKCRVVEDLEEENKLAFQDPDNSPKIKPTPKIVLPTPEEDPEADPYEIGDRIYPPEEIKRLLLHMLDNIRLGEAKVPTRTPHLVRRSWSTSKTTWVRPTSLRLSKLARISWTMDCSAWSETWEALSPTARR